MQVWTHCSISAVIQDVNKIKGCVPVVFCLLMITLQHFTVLKILQIQFDPLWLPDAKRPGELWATTPSCHWGAMSRSQSRQLTPAVF